ELCQLDEKDAAAFGRDMAKASGAIYEAFHPDKINYAAYGDGYPHVHFHLVPKYKGGKSWSAPFDLAEDPAGKLPAQELDTIIALLRSKL
ncbi:MAG: HIT family protein, partial [Spirochaetaceae bacterium]|nr:HIT family protein [Spirochaetaceae bacterium]